MRGSKYIVMRNTLENNRKPCINPTHNIWSGMTSRTESHVHVHMSYFSWVSRRRLLYFLFSCPHYTRQSRTTRKHRYTNAYQTKPNQPTSTNWNPETLNSQFLGGSTGIAAICAEMCGHRSELSAPPPPWIRNQKLRCVWYDTEIH